MSDPVETPVETPVVPAVEAPQEAPTPPQEPAPPSDSTPPEDVPQPSRVVPAQDGYVLPEGVPPAIAQFAHANDMTQEQLDKSIKYYEGMQQAQTKVQQDMMLEAGQALVDSWGDSKDYNLSLAKEALNANDPDGSVKEFLNSTGYGNHPVVLNFMFRLGKQMQEGGFIKGGTHRPQAAKTAAQALFGANHPSVND